MSENPYRLARDIRGIKMEEPCPERIVNKFHGFSTA
jgi:hypothetical protein